MEPSSAERRVADLNEGDRRLYGRLSVHPGPAVDEETAAALAGTTRDQVRKSLDELVTRGLVRRRYSLYDPDAEIIRRINEQADTDGDRRAAIARVIEWYLDVMAAAQRTLNKDRWYLGRHFQDPPVMGLSQPEAIALLSEEIDIIDQLQVMAAELDLHQPAWELPEALGGYFNRRKCHRLAARMHERGLASAEALGNIAVQALMHIGLAQAYLGMRAYRSAIAVAATAHGLAQQAGHRLLEASGLEALGTVALATGHTDKAEQHYSGARRVHIDLDSPRGTALMTRHLGEVALATNDLTLARDRFTDALEYFTDLQPDPYHRLRCLLLLARTDKRAGDLDTAEQTLRTVLDLSIAVAAPVERANALVELADIVADQDAVLALQHRQDAHQLYASVHAPQAADLLTQLRA